MSDKLAQLFAANWLGLRGAGDMRQLTNLHFHNSFTSIDVTKTPEDARESECFRICKEGQYGGTCGATFIQEGKCHLVDISDSDNTTPKDGINYFKMIPEEDFYKTNIIQDRPLDVSSYWKTPSPMSYSPPPSTTTTTTTTTSFSEGSGEGPNEGSGGGAKEGGDAADPCAGITGGQSCNEAPFKGSTVSKMNGRTYCSAGSGETFTNAEAINACCSVGGRLPVVTNMDDSIGVGDTILSTYDNKIQPWMGVLSDTPNVPECEGEECLNKGFYQMVGSEKVYLDEDFLTMYADTFNCNGASDDLDGDKSTCDGCFYVKIGNGNGAAMRFKTGECETGKKELLCEIP